jgi:hypothetical protein
MNLFRGGFFKAASKGEGSRGGHIVRHSRGGKPVYDPAGRVKPAALHPRPGYQVHDHTTEWQECDTCGTRLGAGITTPHDARYYADTWDPDDCPVPGCDGLMALPKDRKDR